MTKAQMKFVPRAAPPFSGRDLLDCVYGIADRYSMQQKPCECGAVLYLVDERIIPQCPACKTEPFPGLIRLTEEDYGPQGPVVKLTRPGGKRARRFELYAGAWFELDANMDRLPQQVEKPALLAELERRGRKFQKPALQEMTDQPRPFIRFVKTASGRVAEYPSVSEPECSCADQDMHDAYHHSALSGVCARHGRGCGTCGQVH